MTNDTTATVASLYPLHGPYSDERTRRAVSDLAELTRYLNYATQAGAGVPYPAVAYDVLGNLRVAAAGLEQLLDQVAERLADQAAMPNARTTSGPTGGGRWPSAATPAGTAEQARIELADAAGAAGRLADRLNSAQVYAGRLWLAETTDDD